MTSREQRALKAESVRLRAALGAIHNHLHAGDVNAAHEACECALDGGEATQANLTTEDGATAMTFASRFNALAEQSGLRACCILLMPSATVPGAVSIQLLGEVGACKVVESMLRGRASTYMGDHER